MLAQRIFDPEHGDDTFLRNVGEHLPGYILPPALVISEPPPELS
jgi:hypothetical protein